jgi:hypothetical protein
MRYRVVLVALVLVACKNGDDLSGTPEAKDMDRWINRDFALPYAYLEDGMTAVGNARAEDYNNEALCTTLQTRAVPDFHKVAELGSKVTPPKGSETKQQDTLIHAANLEAAVGKMATACAAKDASSFAAAHGEMMDAYAAYLDSEHWLDEALHHYGVKRVPAQLPK